MESKMPRYLLGKPGILLLHAGHGGIRIGIAFLLALLQIADSFNPSPQALGCGAMDTVIGRESQPLNGHGFTNTVRIYAGIMQDNRPSQGVANQPDGEIVNDIEQRREVQNMLAYAVHSSRSPGAVSMAAQIKRVDVVALA